MLLTACPDDAPRIIVVEDDDTLTLLLRYNLETAGYRVDIVPDGRLALDALARGQPSLLLLDWNVPGLAGIEVLRQVRRVRGEQIPVVMLTARSAPEDRARALALGADVFLAKPFAIRDLLAVVADLIERSEPACASSAAHGHRDFTSAD